MQIFEQSGAARWGLTPARFEAALDDSAARAFERGSPDAAEIERYRRALHLEDLALAAACADGCEAAWDHFVREHRPALYRAAEAIDRSGGARDLADSLYADLFGLREHDGRRNSLFRYFHGRSSLNTWLRALLAQRHVDRLRVERRLAPLPDDEQMPAKSGAPSSASPDDADRPRLSALMARALEAAVAALPPRDRLRLGCYYGQDLTLAQIGKLLNEHEATVSRHVSRTRRAIRSAVERYLTEDEGLDAAACAECFATAVEDPGTLNLQNLFGSAVAPATVGPSTSLGAGPSTSLGAGPSASLVAGASTPLSAGKNPDPDRSNLRKV